MLGFAPSPFLASPLLSQWITHWINISRDDFLHIASYTYDMSIVVFGIYCILYLREKRKKCIIVLHHPQYFAKLRPLHMHNFYRSSSARKWHGPRTLVALFLVPWCRVVRVISQLLGLGAGKECHKPSRPISCTMVGYWGWWLWHWVYRTANSRRK